MNRQLHPTGLALTLLRTGACAATLTLVTACSNDSQPPPPQQPIYAAEIRRTEFGIPHIKADDEGGLGFGVGYAYAQDNFCMLAERLVTVNGERSRHFGPDASGANANVSNLQTDFFYALVNEAPAVDAAWKAHAEPMKALIDGYVAGYNLYLEETGRAKLPTACKDAAWVRRASASDFVKLMRSYAMEAGAEQFVGAIVAAAPPGPARASAAAAGMTPLDPLYWQKKRDRTGSNGVALGKSATDNGSGMLLANPHFPWEGKLRFYQLHLTIPGKLDVMGVSLGGMPMVNIGFNQHVAWTHTFNTSSHFTLHALQLDPANPRRYMVDGQSRSMTRKSVTVQVKDTDGVVRARTQEFYGSQFGYLMTIPDQLEWNSTTAYALNDANLDNHRMLEQWNAMGKATSVEELKASVDRIVGLPWVNTIAADKNGNTLYMDVSVVPHVSLAKQAACVPTPFKPLAGFGVIVLDAATSACQLGDDSSAPQRAIFSGPSLPRLMRDDYVQNSNDSAWLSNPAAPLTGFPSIVSIDGTAQGGRTRLGIAQLQARLAGTDGKAGKRMTTAQLQELVLSNRVYYADLVMDDLLLACAGHAELASACATMASWDRSANLDANLGLAYFAGVWGRIGQAPGLWSVPFDAADPVHTPRGLKLGDPAVAQAIRTALAATMQDAAALGVPAGARWGDMQGVMRDGRWIPIHGGDGALGIYNAMDSLPQQDGRLHVKHGTSYLQTVSFDSAGPRAQAVLSYSQSTDPASPYYADQTTLFSKKAWITQAFTEAQIKADPAYKSTRISVKR